ncbi:MAG: helix-turn-helix domain-containing protein [Steroidobacteraceae bacterium]
MNDRNASKASPVNALGALLRQWRNTRGKSQIELSLDSGVSQRHVSFIESGRSLPSRETLIGIAEALDIPLRDRNTLLLAAGFAPLYSETAWNASEMRSLTQAIQRILRQHDPFPAVVMDRYWNVLLSNDSAPRFFGSFIDMAARKGPRNLLHLMFDPHGMRPFVQDWETVARSLIQRVYRESVGRVVDEKTKQLLAQLLTYPGVEADWKSPAVSSIGPMTPVMTYSFLWKEQVLNYFSMITTVGSPASVAAQELRIECMFPTDSVTECCHAAVMAAPSVAQPIQE